MLNKKTLLPIVYAIALVGAIVSCVGILTEFFNIAQLYNANILRAAILVEKSTYFVPFTFYLLAFIISALAISLLLLQARGKGKLTKKTVRGMLWFTSIALFIMPFLFFIFAMNINYPFSFTHPGIEYFEYINYYAFRSAAMSCAAHIAILLACEKIAEKSEKNQDNKEDTV